MTTITIQWNTIRFPKTVFKSVDELYDYLQNVYLKNKLEKIWQENWDWPFTKDEAFNFLDNMFQEKWK